MTTERPLLLDINVLVAAAITTHVHHVAAHRAIADARTWWTTPVTETGLVRLLLNPVVTGRDFVIGDVLGVLAGMRGHRAWAFLPDDASLAASGIDTGVITSHRHVTDFHLLDLAARHGGALATFDASLAAVVSPADRHHVVPLPTG